MLSDSPEVLTKPVPMGRPPGVHVDTDTCRGGNEHDVADSRPLQQMRARWTSRDDPERWQSGVPRQTSRGGAESDRLAGEPV